jgi:hypothetical protein
LKPTAGTLNLIAALLELLNPPLDARRAFPYPSGELRPEDEAFWANTLPQPDELTVEEYAVVEATVDSPSHIEFLERIPDKVLEKRACMAQQHQARCDWQGNNSVARAFRLCPESQTAGGCDGAI